MISSKDNLWLLSDELVSLVSLESKDYFSDELVWIEDDDDDDDDELE